MYKYQKHGQDTEIVSQQCGRMPRFISGTIQKTVLTEQNQEYEIGELHTYIDKNVPSNYCWVTYAINRKRSRL